MLGWFKKKFGKKTEEPVAVESEVPEGAAEELVAPPVEAEPVEEQFSQEPMAAVLPEAITPEEPAAVEPTLESSCEEPEVRPEEATAEDIAGTEPETVTVEEVEVAVTLPADVVEPGESLAQVAVATLAESQTPAEPDSAVVAAPEARDATAAGPVPTAMAEEELFLVEDLAAADEEEVVEPDETQPAATILPVSSFAPTQEKPESKSMFRRLQERLGKTRDSFVYRLDRLFLGRKEIDQDLFDQLEEILITADLGVGTTMELLDRAGKKVKRDQLSDPQALKAIIRDQILAYIEAADQAAELVMPAEGPFVIMVVGVNGVGKTTTIGKMAAKFVRSGQSVLLVAGDTFRAAAINQLKIWGERVGVKVIAQNPGSDPSSVVFDGLEYGVAHSYDVVLIDTAGRLHTSVNLMEELKKIRRVIAKKLPGAPHEVMLVLDANTGQNGISQAKLFHEAVGVTGLALTKLDGTAKGGIVANVCRECRIPVRFIGIGEQLDDLRDFDAREFVEALFTQ
jgi:fused signal recognition particle receptor